MKKSVENIICPFEYNKKGLQDMFKDIGRYIINHSESFASDVTENEIVEGYDINIHISGNDLITIRKTTNYYVEREEK